jgi:CDP-6-deoxy-D-xylo-4-hexulose-3-dehydrase
MSGALGIEQMKKLPTLIEERRKNGALLQQALKDHPDLLIQSEIGQSSWFGFSLVIKPGVNLSRKGLVEKLTELGFECRPIVAGNFAKNEAVKYFNSEVYGDLMNAEHIDRNGLFIGNHHYSIADAIEELKLI